MQKAAPRSQPHATCVGIPPCTWNASIKSQRPRARERVHGRRRFSSIGDSRNHFAAEPGGTETEENGERITDYGAQIGAQVIDL